MKNPLFNYVRTFRLRSALSEEDLAFLLNQKAQSAISQFEAGDRVPGLESTLGLEVLFRQTPRQLFPGYYEWVQEEVMRRACELLDRLGSASDQRSRHKRAFLETLAQGHGDDEPL